MSNSNINSKGTSTKNKVTENKGATLDITTKTRKGKVEEKELNIIYEISEKELKIIEKENQKRLRHIYYNIEYKRKLNLQSGKVAFHNLTDDFKEEFTDFTHFLSSYIQHYYKKIDFTVDFEHKAKLCNEFIGELQGFKIEVLDFEKTNLS